MALEKKNLSGMFSEIAPYYDILNRALSFNSDISWRKRSVDMLRLKDDAKILDLCTGTADIAIECARRHSACRVFGVDFSPVMLEKAAGKINKLGLKDRIHLIEADLFDLPFRGGYFDAASIGFGLRNLTDHPGGISEMANAVKAGGRVLILEFSPPHESLTGRAYDIYLGSIVPLFAKIFNASPDAYGYLSSSIRSFIGPEEILGHMRSAGLKNLSSRRMCFGAINAFCGEK